MTRTRRPAPGGWLCGFRYALAALAGGIVSALSGLFAVVLASGVTATLPWLVAVGVLASAGSSAAVMSRLVHGTHNRSLRQAAAGGCAAVAATILAFAFIPAPGRGSTPSQAGMYWNVTAGARVEYRRSLSAVAGSVRRPPIVVLHGGPGIADLDSDLDPFRRMNAWGYDVYAYAQVGAGGSTRLRDPRRYGLERDVADLEEVRRRLGAARVVLVGHSYGGLLATAYARRFPDRVANLVLISPAPLDPDDTSPANARARLTTGQTARLYAEVLTPRPLLAYLLLQVNPSAAHTFMNDAEADRRNDEVLALSEPALHCHGAGRQRPSSRSGFYALQYPQSASAITVDIRPDLRTLTTPTLLVKGSCDYLSWASVIDYRRHLRDATLMYVRGAGHNVHRDRPEEVLTTVHAFLDGRPVPRAYVDDRPPADYEGPSD